MTQTFFVEQMHRLKTRFGEKSFDIELIKLLGREIASVEEDFFRRTVDTWIGMRKNNNPPLLVDFREARLAFEKNNLARETIGASKNFAFSLKEVLQKHYKVETVKEAYELEKLKLVLGGVDEKKQVQGSED
jgi:hypothetical protein